MVSMENCDFEWVGDPVECIYQSFNTQNYTFYRSFRKAEDIYSIGDFVIINRRSSNNSELDEVCKIKALYESREARHQGQSIKAFIQPYLFAKNLHSYQNSGGIIFRPNEIIEDYDSVNIIINLPNVKAKCNVKYYPVKLPFGTINKTEGYYCRYKFETNSISPIVFNKSQMTNTPTTKAVSRYSREYNRSKLQETKVDQNETLVESTDSDKSCTQSKELVNSFQEISDESGLDEPNQQARNNMEASVRRNLCRSFNSDDGSDACVNYSIIDTSPEEKKVRLKLRISRKSSALAVEKQSTRENHVANEPICSNLLIPETLNKSIHEDSAKGNASPIVVIEKNYALRKRNNLLSPTTNTKSPVSKFRSNQNINSPSMRRSNRTIQRVSYADYVSPIKCSPPKRSRLISDNSDSNLSLATNKENLPQENTKINQHKQRHVSPHIREKTPRSKCKTKYYTYVSESDNEDEPNLIVTGKRTVKTPKHYQESYTSPAATLRTPKSTKATHRTPSRKSRLLQDSPKTTPKKTPSSRIKLLRSGTITPSVQNRNKAVLSCDSPLMKARSQLHVSYVPKALPCREKEYQDIYNFVRGKLVDGCGGCMYVSGVPGTGKTATVTSVINNLLESTQKGTIDDFYFISINGMKLTEPRQAYVEIMRQLSKKTLPWEQAQTMLEDRFTKSKQKDKTPIVLLVDELDILCTKRQDVVYNLLDWPMKAKTQLIVITIANTMDLPERLLMNRVTSRLGLTRLTFQAYTHKQLQEIVTKRLTGTNSFNPDAIQLVARKVASVSGDARRALDICRRAAEIAELEGPDTYVSLIHVNEALNAMITQPKVQAIKHCSVLEQLVLQSVVAETERTGVEETVFSDVFKMLISVSAINGFQSVTSGIVLGAVRRLSASRLLISDQKCSNITQRIILNVSSDDVFYALRRD